MPHDQFEDGPPLPAARQGTGLVSLQSLVLLLEIGRSRKKEGKSFILALEEPELHIPPGLQRRLIGDAAAVSDQVLCTTHAPRVAAFFDAASIRILVRNKEGKLEGRQLAAKKMLKDKNSLIQLFTDQRMRLVEALMARRVLVPEGRIDFEWLRLLLDVVETGERTSSLDENPIPPFGSVIGVVPTRDASVIPTYERLSMLHQGVFALVDGDDAGDGYIKELAALAMPPAAIVQWPIGWGIEDAIGWTIENDPDALRDIAERLERTYQSVADLLIDLKSKSAAAGGLKEHYMAHEEIAGAMKSYPKVVQRADLILEALTVAALGQVSLSSSCLVVDPRRSRGNCKVYRFAP